LQIILVTPSRFRQNPPTHCGHYCPTRTPWHRFWNRVRQSPGCWEWQGDIDEGGYGIFALTHGTPQRATRWLIGYIRGWPMVKGEVAAHHCDNRPCVRPSHLFVTDTQGNVADRDAKGRQMRGERHHAAVLTEALILEIRAEWQTGQHSQQMLANRYGIHQTTVSRIVSSYSQVRIWKHV
jgi:hypothetical protein